jgi:L-threonylcarbamoyladenylate synthase
VSATRDAIAALREGETVVLPFDTVYGVAADAFSDTATRKMYDVKGRVYTQPTAIVAASVDALIEALPELKGKAESLIRELLPAPYTLILPNPARRFRWLTGDNQDGIGVRIPELPTPTDEVVAAVGVVVATSANHPGEPDPSTLAEVPDDIRARAGAVIDRGPVPGTPSTIIDVTGPEPRVVRRGLAPPEDVLRRLGAAVRST